MIRKDKLHIVLLACVLALCLAANGSVSAVAPEQQLTSLAGSTATESAPPGADTDTASQNEESSTDVTAADEPDNYVPLYINGVLHSECLVIDGVARMSLGRFADLAGLNFDGHTIEGVAPKVSADENWAEVNGRYFYLRHRLYELGGEMNWPLKELARMFGCTVTWDEASNSINLDLTDVELLASGDEYYSDEDVYWLSRIIYAESGNQPLEGQIAVGNVVLNRVADERFPDSVYEVIFDTTYGVQFSPVETGGIYAEPDEEAIVAAKLALEGYNTGGTALYFVNPAIGASSWFNQTRTYVTSIGDHVFYA